MKKFQLIICLSFVLTNLFPSNSQTISSPYFNAKAPSDVNDNLNINDLAIAVDAGQVPKTVRVFDKKEGLYLVGPLDATDYEIKNKTGALKWYKTNSVYKYYDINLFKEKTGKYLKYIEPYMLCFAQKYNIGIDVLTGNVNWPTYYFQDEAEKVDQIKNLEELYQLMIKEFRSLPNTYLPYSNNPFLWWVVANNRVSFVDCLSKVQNPNTTRMVDFYLKEIASAKTAAANFKGGTADLYDGTTYLPMLRAVSKKAREEWLSTQNGWNTNTETILKINTALDELKIICEPKFALLKMDATLFKYHDTDCEASMKAYLKNPSTLKIHKIGISDAEWIYVKNSVGVILYRYKRGTMWVRNSADDHTHCKGLFFVIKQEYNGSSYSKSMINEYSEELRGCI